MNPISGGGLIIVDPGKVENVSSKKKIKSFSHHIEVRKKIKIKN